MKSLCKWILFLFLIAPGGKAFAQGGGIGNGGDLNEITLIARYDQLTRFLGTPEGRETFPEVSQSQFLQLREKLILSIIDEELKDKTNQSRSELNFWTENSAHQKFAHIQIHRSAIQKYLGNEPELYVILLHACLNLLKFELSEPTWSKKVTPSSIYPISSRILKFARSLGSENLFQQNLQLNCAQLNWIGHRLRRTDVTLNFDQRELTEQLRSFDHPDWDEQIPTMGRSVEVHLESKTSKRPFLAQNIRGNAMTIAFEDFSHPGQILRVKILLPTLLTKGEESFARISDSDLSVSDHPNQEQMLENPRQQSHPGEIPDLILSCSIE